MFPFIYVSGNIRDIIDCGPVSSFEIYTLPYITICLETIFVICEFWCILRQFLSLIFRAANTVVIASTFWKLKCMPLLW